MHSEASTWDNNQAFCMAKDRKFFKFRKKTCQYKHVHLKNSFLKSNELQENQNNFQGKRQSQRTNDKLQKKVSATPITGFCAKCSG